MRLRWPAIWLGLLALAGWLLASQAGVSALTLKRDGLQFHTRDYNYFIEQAARLTDPGLTKRFAANIEGYNFLGLQGIEGVKNLYQAIHAEYFRYVYALVYGLTRQTAPIYWLFCLLFFSPVLYAAWLVGVKRGAGPRQASPGFALLFILLYLLFPGAIPSVAADLRTRLLFAAAWSLAGLAVYFDRPFAAKLAFVVFLPFIREEGIILGALITGLNFILMRGKPGRARQTLILSLLLALALAAFLAFMAYGGYQRVDNQFNPLNVLSAFFLSLPGLAAMALGLAALFALIRQRRSPRLWTWLFWLVYAAGVGLAVLQLWRDFQVWYAAQSALGPVSLLDCYLRVITWEQTSLLYAMLAAALLLAGSSAQGSGRRWLWLGGWAFCLGMALTTGLVIPQRFAAWQARLEPARLVWQFKETQDRYTTRVLVDFNTYQAFYDYNDVIVYNRLPVAIVYPNLDERFYPRDKELVAREISRGIYWGVIARSSLDEVSELARLAKRDCVVTQSNADFLVVNFR